MSELAAIERDLSPTDIHEIPSDYEFKRAVDLIVEKCGGDRNRARSRCLELLHETLVMEPKQ